MKSAAAFLVVALVACGTKHKEIDMGMTDDHARLLELERSKGTLQYGQNLQVTPAPGADLIQASKDLIRFVGDKTDINALRIYLGPWQPRPDIPIPGVIATAAYADPSPWAPPEPRTFDSFAPFPCYARIMWGSGGIQNTAYVDWPKRGLLLQVSGSYLQVNAFVNTTSATAHVPSTEKALPLLAATMGPEPGGGDSSQPATFTYPLQDAQGPGAGAVDFFQNFQIPPFARAFVLVADFDQLVTAAATIKISTQLVPQDIGALGSNDVQVWVTPIGGTYDQGFITHPFPISGQEVGNVRVEISSAGHVAGGAFGMMFLLDL